MTAAEWGERPWIDYEWAAIRIVPRVHTERFATVGIVLHARQAGLLAVRLAPDWTSRVRALAPGCEVDRIDRHLESYAGIGRGDDGSGPIALLPPSERFHWLTHPRSGVLQTSPRHPGRTRDPEETLARLLAEQCR